MTTELLNLEYRDEEEREITLRQKKYTRKKNFEKETMKFETSSVLITRKIDIETYAYVHESVLGIKFALCNPIFGEMPIVALRHNFHIIRTMLSQSSQFTFVIYARTAFTSFKRRLTDKKRKKKKKHCY